MLRKVLFFAYFLSVHLEKSSLLCILKLKDNLYHKMNEIVHKTINRLFLVLKLNVNFKESTRVRLFLTIHSDFNNIAEKICKVHQEIVKLVVTYNTLRLDINEVLDKFINELRDNRTDNDFRNNTIQIQNKARHENSEEPLDFINDFIEKINRLTVNDFINSTDSVSKLRNENGKFAFTRRRNKVHNLKVWSKSFRLILKWLCVNLHPPTNDRRFFENRKSLSLTKNINMSFYLSLFHRPKTRLSSYYVHYTFICGAIDNYFRGAIFLYLKQNL